MGPTSEELKSGRWRQVSSSSVLVSGIDETGQGQSGGVSCMITCTKLAYQWSRVCKGAFSTAGTE